MKKYYLLGVLASLFLSSHNLSAMEEPETSSIKKTSKKVFSSARQPVEEQIVKIKTAIDEVRDLSKYTARPVKTNSLEEAWSILKNHCKTMFTFHSDISKMYTERKEKYLNNKREDKEKSLQLFLKAHLGFKLSRETNPEDYLTTAIVIHNQKRNNWETKLAEFTGLFRGQLMRTRYHPCYLDCQSLKSDLTKEFNSLLQETFEDSDENDLKKLVKNQPFKNAMDELWAFRYALAIVEPWADPKLYDEYWKEAQLREEIGMEKYERALKIKEDKKRRRAAQKAKWEKKREEQLLSTVSPLSPPIKSEENETSGEKVGSSKYVGKEEEFDEKKHIEGEREKSKGKKQQQKLKENMEREEKTKKGEKPQVKPHFSLKTWPMKAKHYNIFMDLFTNERPVKFKAFKLAFRKGLKGEIYENKGGASRTFVLGKFPFNLHTPHRPKKGALTFYEELRSMAIDRLADVGVTKETICLKNK
ncbi:MAG: hypothetical protein BGO67_05905 [Alphaproteobacteria bacterium 41-28]|nr:MAG: hypothetical protein BGO67_05905 [Alphaproteobacteria bacterium 41-28]